MLNLSKVLELLKLPQDMEVFVGQINSCTRYSLVENRTTDFTNVENGKRVTKVTSTFSSVPTVVKLGAYNHNLLSTYTHGYDYNPLGFIGNEYVMTKDGITFTAETGPFVGQTYYIGWSQVKIEPTVNGFDMRVESEPWMFTAPNGLPSPAKMSITRINTTITGNVSISKNGTVTVTNKRTTTGGKQYPSYTQAELETLTNMNEEQISKVVATVFHMSTPSHETHCVALGTDIEIENNKLTGVIYINGIKHTDIDFRSLIASYGKTLPDFVTRWKVYNPSNQSGVFGTAIPAIQRSSSADQSINIVKGDVLQYDAITNTLTYTDNTELVFDFEFLPAQGKNETWGSKIDLNTFTEDIY